MSEYFWQYIVSLQVVECWLLFLWQTYRLSLQHFSYQTVCFGHVRTCYQEVLGDLTSCCRCEFCVCCHLICFYVVTVNKFSMRGCKGECDFSFLHNIMVTPTYLTSGTSPAEWVLCAPAAEISRESWPAGMFELAVVASYFLCAGGLLKLFRKIVEHKYAECVNLDNNLANSSLWDCLWSSWLWRKPVMP